MFPPLPSRFEFPQSERDTLAFWAKHRVFERSLSQRADAPAFVFYEGPPTANGKPHPGHCLTRAMKDLFPRYRAMCGYSVGRKAGWDTHGLPVEVEVCKELGIHTKAEIEAYGVERFNLKCIESVFRYMREWEEMTTRLGFWVDLTDAYVTHHESYVNSVWWGLKTLFDRGLLYQGHKVVWWWCQGGTALSAGEVGEGYREVDDPSVFVKFPLLPPKSGDAEQASLLVWTTTPWTLISNHFAAVHPDLEYALVEDPGAADGGGPERLYVAAALVDALGKKVKRELRTISICPGSALIGRRYLPPFPECYQSAARDDGPPLGERSAALREGGSAPVGWRVTAAEFVTTDSGTGLVHEAPAFGEVDFELLQAERRRFASDDAIPLLCAVNPDGCFNEAAPQRYRGRWIKECDKELIRELRDERRTPWGTPLLWHQEQVRHPYPFCPRAEKDPLIQYARKSWFVRTSRFKDDFLANNAQIRWLPEHIREGRFGDFLRNNVDWALSRERYWGTPLPVWVCETTGKMEAVGSLPELERKPGATDATPEFPQGYWRGKCEERARAGEPPLPGDLRIHKPYIDAWTYDSPFSPGARMRRVTEVIDCWWDSGSMPFAQWGYPLKNADALTQRLPADFISEAIDQTRGWFYALLAISTLLRGELSAAGGGDAPRAYPLPYRTCIVLGLMLGEDGTKMSKRLKNYREPSYIFDAYGADAMRWYFFSAQAPWTTVRFQEAAIRDAQREFLVKLYNVVSFFNIYANLDGFVPHPKSGSPWRPTAERCEIDRWIISELQRTIAFVREKMDAFENFPAATRLNDFVEALSNWWVRRSRDRFWRSEKDQDKWDAYHTLYGTLLTLSMAIAPFTPFFAEFMFRSLTGNREESSPDTAPQPCSASAGFPETGLPVSVHLCDYPKTDERLVDAALAEEMELVRQIVSLGRAARTDAKLRTRQPLSRVEIILSRSADAERLRLHEALIAEELNVRLVEFARAAEEYVTYEVKPNFKALGPKFGALAPKIKAALAGLDAAAGRRELVTEGVLRLTVEGRTIELTPEDVEIRLAARPGWAAAQDRAGVVVLSTELTPELLDEGRVREFIHHVQALRKECAFEYSARIALYAEMPAPLDGVIRGAADWIARECLVERLELAIPAGVQSAEVQIDDWNVRLAARPIAAAAS